MKPLVPHRDPSRPVPGPAIASPERSPAPEKPPALPSLLFDLLTENTRLGFPRASAATATADRRFGPLGHSAGGCPGMLGQPKSWRHNVFMRFVPLSRG